MANSRWTADKMPDMSGRVVVVTGASSGIGAITAGELARTGARVVLAVRDVAKGEAATAKMAGETDVRQLDLTEPRLGPRVRRRMDRKPRHPRQ